MTRQFYIWGMTAILCLACTVSADAQARKRYKRSGSKLDIKYGIKFGYQSSKLIGDEFVIEFDSDNLHVYPEVTYQRLPGFHGGAYMDIMLNKGYSLLLEIQYVQLGSRITRQVDISNVEGSYIVNPSSDLSNVFDIEMEQRLDYIQIPIINKIAFTHKAYLHLGPVISFKMSESTLYGNVSDSLITRLDLIPLGGPDRFNGLDYGATIGFSYQMDGGLNFGIRYLRNFNNVNMNEGLDILAVEPQNFNSSIMVNMGFTFQYAERLRTLRRGRAGSRRRR